LFALSFRATHRSQAERSLSRQAPAAPAHSSAARGDREACTLENFGDEPSDDPVMVDDEHRSTHDGVRTQHCEVGGMKFGHDQRRPLPLEWVQMSGQRISASWLSNEMAQALAAMCPPLEIADVQRAGCDA
jgi:hypothetical protein